jgi:tetratricopeptide (TPR) repeat protein
MARLQLFLSTVSAEFRNYREVLRHNLNLPDVTIQIQEDFIAGGVPTLEKLDLYIRQCDAVIHLVGDGLGSQAKPRSLAYLNNRYPELASRFSVLGEFLSPEGPSLSYTQWEAWLALLHGRKLLICVPTPGSPRQEGFAADPKEQVLQQRHLARMRSFEAYPEVNFHSIDQLTWQIKSSLFLELRTAAGQIRPPTTLPYASLGKLLKGRDHHLQTLQQQLGPIPRSATTPSKAVALIGLGGVGKTRLAIEHAWRNAALHSAVVFVPASTPEALNRSLAGLTAVLDLPQKVATEEAIQRQAVLCWLCSHPGWLLILDGIDDKAAAQAVEALLPQISGGQLLFTTRLSKWSAVVQRLPLEVLSTETAAEFLMERTAGGRKQEADDPLAARDLAQQLDGLALALEQAGAYIDERRITFSRYRQEWQQRRQQLLSWCDPQLMQYPQSVATTWLTSFQQLSAAAQTLLRRLAWFSTEPIPESLLEVAVAAGDGDTAEPIEAIEAMDGLVELDRYSLLSRSSQSDSFLLHRLVQEVTRLRQDSAQEPHELEAALAWIEAAFVGNPQDVRSWPVLEPLEPHAKAVANFAAEVGVAGATARLLSHVGGLLSTKAVYGEAEPLYRSALQIAEARYGRDHHNVAMYLNNLAHLLQDTNRFAEAEPMMRRGLAIEESTNGKDHPNVAIQLNNLALLLKDTNRLAEAEPLMRRALQIDEASYGQDHPRVATDLCSLAQLLKATNRLSEAEPLMRRALQIDEASYGQDHPRVATQLNNLAQLLQATNRLVEAEPPYRLALRIAEASYGQDHPDVAIYLNNLATLLQYTNRLSEAEPLMRRALQIDEVSYGQDHCNVAIQLSNLAQLLKATNRLAEAEPLMRRALQIDEVSYGQDHPRVATDLINLAQLLKDTNRLAEAEPLMRRALQIDEASYGKDHPNVATDLNNLAQLLQYTNRLAEAEPLMRRALQIDEASYGQDHPKVAIRLNNLAGLLQATNRLAEAEPLMRSSLVIFLSSLGLGHPNSQTVLENYRKILQAQGLSEAAIQAKLASLNPQG